MKYKVLLSVLAMALTISAMQGVPLALATKWSAGGDYSNTNIISSSVNSNVPPLENNQATLSTSIWQGTYTDTNYFLQEVLNMNTASGGWQIAFVGYNSANSKIDNVWTNSYASAGCTVQYNQNVLSANHVYAFVRQSSGSGCTSMTQSYTFTAGSGSYGSKLYPIYVEIEDYDSNCSDYTGFGNITFTNGLVTNSGGTSSTPTYTAFNNNPPSCFSATAGSGWITITHS
ncbi:MAG: hypothetical protein ACYC6W_01395 [Nitrosotalea sp.]